MWLLEASEEEWCISQCSTAVKKMPEVIQIKRRKNVFWPTDPEISGNGWLALWLLGVWRDRTSQWSAWFSIAAQLQCDQEANGEKEAELSLPPSKEWVTY